MEINELKQTTQMTLNQVGITELSDIQKKSVPVILSHQDVLVQAPTGSGKTLCYLIPILEQIELQGKGKHFPHFLILVPTRELALQTLAIIRRLLEKTEGVRAFALTGGVDINKQIRQFHQGADIVVATPARLLDHIRRHTFKQKDCHMVIIDEADLLLSMGFEEDVRHVLSFLPEHQTIMLSATFTEEIIHLTQEFMKEPIQIKETKEQYLSQNIQIHIIEVKEKQKLDALKDLLKNKKQTIVFCNTKKTCDWISKILHLPAIHSDMDAKRRKEIMQEFRDGLFPAFVSTDVNGRGIDIVSLKRVILYDYPDQEDFLLHRIGRVSRDGSQCEAYVFLKPSEKEKQNVLETTFRFPIDFSRYINH